MEPEVPPVPATRAPKGGKTTDLRRLLIETALHMVQTEGLDTVSVREVARRAGVSSGAPFRHFRDRNALLTAIAEEGHEGLERDTEAALVGLPDDPVARLRAIGVTVTRYAAEHPAHFRVMHLDLPRSPRVEELIARKHGFMRGLIVDGQARGMIQPGDPDEVALCCVALVYGLARFYVDGLTGFPVSAGLRDPARVDALAQSVVNYFGLGLATPAYWASVCPGTCAAPAP